MIYFFLIRNKKKKGERFVFFFLGNLSILFFWSEILICFNPIIFFKMLIHRLFYHLDIFKSPFLLRISEKEKTSALLGFFFSLGIMIFLVIFFVNSDVFYHLRPNIIDEQLFVPRKLKLDFNGNNFGLVAALIDDPGNVYNDDSMFSISMTQFVLNCSAHEILSQDIKSLHPCDENDYPDNPGLVDLYGLRNYSCPSNKSFSVEGGWDEPIINHIYVTLAICKNSTMNNTCKPYDEIFDFLSNKYFAISFMDSSYDLNNYRNPLQNSYKSPWWTVGANLRKTVTLYWKKVEIVTDTGFVFRKAETLESFQLDEKNIDIDLNYEEFIFQAEFYSSPRKEYATRTYQKIQEVIASIGGLLNLFVAIGFILIGPQTRLNVIKTIMNKLYVFHKANPKIKLKTSQMLKVKNEANSQKPQFLTKKLTKSEIDLKFTFEKAQFSHIKNSLILKPEQIKQSERKESSPGFAMNPSNPKNEVLNDELKLENSSNLSNPVNSYNEKNDDLLIKFDDEIHSDPVLGINTEEKQERLEIDDSHNFSIKEGNPKAENTKVTHSNVYRKGFSVFSKARLKASETNQTQNRNVRKIMELEEQSKKNDKSEFEFSLFEYFVYNIKKIFRQELTFKESLFKKAEKTFKKEVDLITILQRIHEIDKMKLILLNQRQITLFELLSKPMIFVDKNKWETLKKSNTMKKLEDDPAFKMSSFIREGKRAVKQKETIMECYEETLKHRESSIIDERLVYFMDQKAEGRNLEQENIK